MDNKEEKQIKIVSGNGKNLDIYAGNLPMTAENMAAMGTGRVELSKPREWSIGLQVMFQF